MAMKTGTYDISSLLAVTNQSVASFGVDRVAAVLAADLRAWNRMVREDMLGDLTERTTDRQRIWGISTTGTMMEVDEYGRAPTQKQAAPPAVAFPLRLFQHPIGWTARWMRTKTPADLAIAQQGAQIAELRTMRRELQKAIYLSANYTFVDRLVDNVSLSVKRLLNADSTTIPDGPNGETFTGSSHTHYTAEATLSAAGLTDAVENVIEHGVSGPVRIAFNVADDATIRALTGFIELNPSYLVPATNADNARGPELNTLVLNDRQIGFFGAAEVWIKPWAIANYAVIYDAGAGGDKPVAMRVNTDAGLQGLRIAAELDTYPLHAQFMESEFGFAAWNRAKAAVHQFSNGTYQDPTIT